MKLLLPADLQARIEDETRGAFPRECCGLIEGTRQDGEAHAIALHPARNIATLADRFEIAPEDHFAALKTARANGRDLIGCYHSHPNGKAAPSAADLAGAGEEDFFWLIASLSARDAPVTFAAFVYSAAGFFPVNLSGALGALGADLVTSSVKARN
jgi:proteasome lid subunit RPN8/RPN11